MRLIDADKLMNKYKGHHDFYLNAWGGDFKSMDAKDKARCDELTNCIAEIVNASTIKTKQVKYYDEDESVWKVGSVIVDGEREGE